MSKDYYEILGVGRDATDAQIKSAYRKLAREWHPDVAKSKPNAEEKFKEINEAYQVLGDAQKKSQYDRFGHTADQQNQYNNGGGGAGFNPFGGGFGGGPFTWSYSTSEGDASDVDPFDIFEQVFGFRGFGGSNKGRSLRYSLAIDFEDSIKGYEDVIEVNGHKLKIKLNPGVEDGTAIKFAGKGEKSKNPNSEPGDILVTIQINPSNEFNRRGLDVFSTKDIDLKDAILGGSINIKTIDPKSKTGYTEKKLKIPGGTQSDTIFKLNGMGMPHPKGYGRGNHYITVRVTIPKNLTKQQKEALINYF